MNDLALILDATKEEISNACLDTVRKEIAKLGLARTTIDVGRPAWEVVWDALISWELE